MNIICKPRGCGKTYDLIMESARTGHPIITATQRMSRYINEQAKFMGVKIKQAISVEEYKIFNANGSLFNSPCWTGKVLIDDVDLVLNELLNVEIQTVTCTPDNMNDNFYKGVKNMTDNQKITYTSTVSPTTTLKNKYDNISSLTYNYNNTSNNSVNLNEVSLSYADKIKSNNLFRIVDVNVIVPNKVVEVTFLDGTKEKSVCREPDVFSLEQAIGICISKKVMGGSSAYNNAVKRGIKVYEKQLFQELLDNKEQERIERKRAKKKAYKERRATKKEQEEKEKQIEIQKEAYIRAMMEVENMKSKGV